MGKKLTTLCLIFVAAGVLKILSAEDYVNPYRYNSEYEMDMLQNYFHPEDEFLWLGAENGFRTTGGSLNIRHIYNFQEAKFRFELVKNRFYLRYIFLNNQYLNYEVKSNLLELEYFFWRNIFLKLTLQPDRHKGDIDAGFGLGVGLDEKNKVWAEYRLVDFDKNYAFRNRTVYEGYEEFYDTLPKKWIFGLNSQSDKLKIGADFWVQTPSELRHSDFVRNDNYKQEYEEIAFNGNILRSLDTLGLGVRGKYYGNKYKIYRPDGYTREDRAQKVIEQVITPYALYRINERNELFSGVSFINLYGSRMPYLETSEKIYYKGDEILPFINWYYSITPKSRFETGYMHDSIYRKELIQPDTFKRGMRRENRLRLAYEYRFTEKIYMKFMMGWELDKEDFGKSAFFDGGYFQFQGVF